MEKAFCEICESYYSGQAGPMASDEFCYHPRNKNYIRNTTYLSKADSKINRNYKTPAKMNMNNNCMYYRKRILWIRWDVWLSAFILLIIIGIFFGIKYFIEG